MEMPYHLLSPPLHSLAMRNNQRNLVMSCVTWQNKSISDSCRRALQNCMAQIKINIKIYREICKTCPTRCPRPCSPTPSPTPLPVLSDRSCGAKCKLRQRFFLALASSAFCGETLKANYLTCDIMREWIPWGPWNWQIDPFAFQTMAKGDSLALRLGLIETAKRPKWISWSIKEKNALLICILYSYNWYIYVF